MKYSNASPSRRLRRPLFGLALAPCCERRTLRQAMPRTASGSISPTAASPATAVPAKAAH